MNFIIIVAAFLIGSVPVGYIIGKVVGGGDVRNVGSGNIGATNVARLLGKKWAAVVLFLDVVKGSLPVLVSWHVLQHDIVVVVAVALSTLLGSVIGPFLKKGGKGVATSAGIMLILAPWAILVALAVWIGVFKFSHYSSLSSLSAALALFLAQIVLPGSGGSGLLLLTVVMVIIIIYTHRENIGRLLRGMELKS